MNLEKRYFENSLLSYIIIYKKKFRLLIRNAEAVVGSCSVKKGILRNFAKFTGKHSAINFVNEHGGLFSYGHILYHLL